MRRAEFSATSKAGAVADIDFTVNPNDRSVPVGGNARAEGQLGNQGSGGTTLVWQESRP